MKILIVEDDKNFGRVLTSELRECGYEVELAVDGVDGVLKFIDGRHDFVVLDIQMPKLDGINALRIMKKICPDTLGVTYSGNAGSGEMADAVRAGALRCLTKPFEIAQLKTELKRHEGRCNRTKK